MRLEQLRYIVEIADSGSFTLASQRLFVAQPSVSQAVMALEKALNVTLFTRMRTGAIPTPVGVQIIAKAREALNAVAEIEELTSSDFSKINSVVNVGTIPALAVYLLPRVIAGYRKIFPNVTVRIREEGTQKIIRECETADISLGLIARHGPLELSAGLEFRPLLTGRLTAYVGKSSPLANRLRVTFRDLIPYELFLFGDEFSLHRYCLDQISRYGEPKILSTTHNPETIKRFVMQSGAVGFSPDISLRDDIYVDSGAIIPLEIEDASKIEFGLLTSVNRKPSVAVDAMLKEIFKYR